MTESSRKENLHNSLLLESYFLRWIELAKVEQTFEYL